MIQHHFSNIEEPISWKSEYKCIKSVIKPIKQKRGAIIWYFFKNNPRIYDMLMF